MLGRAIHRFGAAMVLAASLTLPRSLQAQPGGPHTSGGQTEILFLGTAGGPPLRRDRSEPATLIVVDGHSYLFDCGIGTMQQLLKANIDPQGIKTIFLTHLHSDHDLGLADVLGDDFFVLNLRGASDSIDIYGPPQTQELVDAAFHFIAIAARPFAVENPGGYRRDGNGLANPFKVHEFDRDGVVYSDGTIRVTAAENSHYSLMTPTQRRTFKSYAYRIETPHGTIVLTGDTGPSGAVEQLAQGADVLVAEADAVNAADRESFIGRMAARNHWTAERTRGFRAHFISEHLDTGEIGKMAAAAHVKSVLLYHYDPGDAAPHATYVDGVRQSFAGPVYAPDDLDRFCLGNGQLHACPLPERR